MKVSISRSVGRALAVMEVFKQTRRPASATQLSRRLDAPHSSVVAVLHHLRDMGYLSFDQSDMTYFPTTKLLELTAWMRASPQDHGRLGTLLDRVARESGHTMALVSRVSLFVNTVSVRTGRFTNVTAPARSAGAALAASVPGIVILAQLEDDELHDLLRQTEAWLRDAGARKSYDTAITLSRIDQARRTGFLAGAHPACRGTDILAFAVSGAQGTPFALAAHIPACLSRSGRDELRQLLETRVRDSAPALPRLPAGHAGLPGPGARTQDFGPRFAPAGRDAGSIRMLASQFDAG